MNEQSHSPWWGRVRDEVGGGRQWLDRAVVLAYAVATGLTVVGFTYLAEAGSEGFRWLSQVDTIGRWMPLLWTPALTVALLWLTQRFADGTQGSGIPQVVAVLDYPVSDQVRARLVSLPLSLKKILLVSGGLLAGLSIGREGPTVQVGAGVMQHARRWLSQRSTMERVAGQSMVLSLMAVALVATGESRLLTRPMFSELAALLVPQDASASAPSAKDAG